MTSPSKDRAEAHTEIARMIAIGWGIYGLEPQCAEEITKALDNAFAEGMKRAAGIARNHGNLRRTQAKDEMQFNKFERRDFDSMAIACRQVASEISFEAEAE